MKINKRLLIFGLGIVSSSGVLAQTFYQCMPCLSGTYSSSGKCINCPAGKYQNLTGQLSCKACPAGSYCPAGSVEPKPCLPGQYQDATGQGSCKSCPAGQVSNSGATFCRTFGSGGTLIGVSGGRGTLAPGAYRVELSGGRGGKGQDNWCYATNCNGCYGGNGYTNSKVFVVTKDTNYTYSIGSIGANGSGGPSSCNNRTQTPGKQGGTTTFTLSGVFSISAQGGPGGPGGRTVNLGCGGGCSDAVGGNGSNGNGWLKIYKM